MAKKKKERADQYDKKLAIEGTLDEVLKVSTRKAPDDGFSTILKSGSTKTKSKKDKS